MARLALALLLPLAAVGCDDPGPPRPTVVPVAGTLTVDGRPVANARLAFHPMAGSPVCPVGLTRPDGTFQLTTHVADDGAPAGDYAVTVFWPDETVPMDECGCPDFSVHDRFRGRYADAARSDLRATVGPGPTRVALATTVGTSGWHLPRVTAPATAGREPAGREAGGQ